ncbi:MAG: HD-GYP domain-containing protein [Planctomycetota bacterium]|nr:HD-GYP domain-containing protein [Planctomycetota bacterium]
MSDHERPTTDSAALRKLRHRCFALGLPTWTCDESQRIISRPGEIGIVPPWLDSPRLSDGIEAALYCNGEEAEPAILTLKPGAWLIKLPLPDQNDGPWCVIALALCEGFSRSASFTTFSQESDLDPEDFRSQLKPFMKFQHSQLVHIQHMLNWAMQDLTTLDENEAALSDLSKQLSYTYDEISTLYQLGRSMNNLFEPRLFVNSVCSQLHYLLEFNWIAIQYIPSSLALSGLEHELIFEGELPIEQEAFSRFAVELISKWQADLWTSILETDASPMASQCGSQIVVEPISHDGVIIGAIFAGEKNSDDPDASSVDIQLMDTTSDFLGVFHQNSARFEVQRSQYMGTVRALSSSIDAKDPYTRGHSDRVAHLAAELAKVRNMSSEQVEEVYITGLLHDVGKIGVPETTLCKAGSLTKEEFDQIKQHPVIGYEILKDIPLMSDLLPGVLHHHERWDGNGYPHGLKGESIPLLGRLLAVADAFDAMSSDRSYRARMPREKVISILRDGAGTQWDADMVSQFLTLDFAKYDEMVLREAITPSKAA